MTFFVLTGCVRLARYCGKNVQPPDLFLVRSILLQTLSWIPSCFVRSKEKSIVYIYCGSRVIVTSQLTYIHILSAVTFNGNGVTKYGCRLSVLFSRTVKGFNAFKKEN